MTKIGFEMLENSGLVKIIAVPLKTRLYRIDPGAKIFGSEGADINQARSLRFSATLGWHRNNLRRMGRLLPNPRFLERQWPQATSRTKPGFIH